MRKPEICIIAAIGKNTRAIGKKNGLIWKIEGDLPRFKRLTLGRPIIMGRKTFQSFPNGPLPGRTNIVVTREDDKIEGAVVVHSIKDALAYAHKEKSDQIFIIGGGEIYLQTIGVADRLYLTIVDSDEPGDVFFPEYRNTFKTVVSEEHHDEHNPPFHYVELVR